MDSDGGIEYQHYDGPEYLSINCWRRVNWALFIITVECMFNIWNSTTPGFSDQTAKGQLSRPNEGQIFLRNVYSITKAVLPLGTSKMCLIKWPVTIIWKNGDGDEQSERERVKWTEKWESEKQSTRSRW